VVIVACPVCPARRGQLMLIDASLMLRKVSIYTVTYPRSLKMLAGMTDLDAVPLSYRSPATMLPERMDDLWSNDFHVWYAG